MTIKREDLIKMIQPGRDINGAYIEECSHEGYPCFNVYLPERSCERGKPFQHIKTQTKEDAERVLALLEHDEKIGN